VNFDEVLIPGKHLELHVSVTTSVPCMSCLDFPHDDGDITRPEKFKIDRVNVHSQTTDYFESVQFAGSKADQRYCGVCSAHQNARDFRIPDHIPVA